MTPIGRLLSQEEIDALLASAALIQRASRDDTTGAEDAKPYDFRKPERINQHLIHSLHYLHDRFARSLSTAWSGYLRTTSDVTLDAIEQTTYGQFRSTLPDATAIYACLLQPFEGLAVVELNPAVAFAMVDRLFGGSGRSPVLARAFTEIEQTVLDAVINITLDALGETWRSAVEVKFEINARETRPAMLQVAAPSDPVVVLTFTVSVSGISGPLTLCLPAPLIESVRSSFTRGGHRPQRGATAIDRRSLHENLSRMSLSVTASLETRMPARELLALRPGDVVVLGHTLRNPIALHVGSVQKFAGQLVRSDAGAGLLIQPGASSGPTEPSASGGTV